MNELIDHHAPTFDRPTLHRPRRRRRWVLVAVVTAVLVAVALVLVVLARVTADRRRAYLGTDAWPVRGQAAFVIDGGPLRASPDQRPVPIASVAKLMTAYLILRAHPLRAGAHGPTLTVTAADVADTERRRARDESLVDVAAGERLTERQALLAMMLPSANNVAVLATRLVDPSVRRFVARMNATARDLGMTATTYTDPSGFDDRTVSTAADQTRLARAIAGDGVLADIVATPSAQLPVAGTVHNTDRLLGHGGFVGTKTGSDDAAGGCFTFRVERDLDGRRVTMIGTVLGQRGHNLIDAGLYASRQLADRALAG